MPHDRTLPALPAGTRAIDTHCHLDMIGAEHDLNEVLARAEAAGVDRILSVGIDPASSRAAILLAEQHPQVFATVGVHPHHVADMTPATYEELRDLARHPRVVAYGEIGLDYAKMYAPVAVQKEHFRRQVELGRDLGLPLVIHDRDAHRDVLDILTGAGPLPAGGVVHCFSGDLACAEEVLALGFHISIPGIVTFNKAEELQEIARRVPLDRLLIETDGPFLTPQPWRGRKSNEPAYVLFTARKIAELRDLPLDAIVARTTENAARLFRLDGVAESA